MTRVAGRFCGVLRGCFSRRLHSEVKPASKRIRSNGAGFGRYDDVAGAKLAARNLCISAGWAGVTDAEPTQPTSANGGPR